MNCFILYFGTVNFGAWNALVGKFTSATPHRGQFEHLGRGSVLLLFGSSQRLLTGGSWWSRRMERPSVPSTLSRGQDVLQVLSSLRPSVEAWVVLP